MPLFCSPEQLPTIDDGQQNLLTRQVIRWALDMNWDLISFGPGEYTDANGYETWDHNPTNEYDGVYAKQCIKSGKMFPASSVVQTPDGYVGNKYYWPRPTITADQVWAALDKIEGV